jgi:hypothetical protein
VSSLADSSLGLAYVARGCPSPECGYTLVSPPPRGVGHRRYESLRLPPRMETLRPGTGTRRSRGAPVETAGQRPRLQTRLCECQGKVKRETINPPKLTEDANRPLRDSLLAGAPEQPVFSRPASRKRSPMHPKRMARARPGHSLGRAAGRTQRFELARPDAPLAKHGTHLRIHLRCAIDDGLDEGVTFQDHLFRHRLRTDDAVIQEVADQ